MSKKSRRRPDRSDERSFRHKVRRHEADIVKAEGYFEDRLRDPEWCEAKGLPAHPGEFAIDVLRQTQAMDKVGPKRPRRAEAA